MTKDTPESRLHAIRRKSRTLTQAWDQSGVEIKLRSYTGIKVRPSIIDAVTETFVRSFRIGKRGGDLWHSVIAAHPEATNWELTVAGGRTARRVFTDHRMRQSYRYQEHSLIKGVAS